MVRVRGLAAAAAALVLGAASASASVAGLPAWDVVPSPDPSVSSEFLGVSAVSPGQVWAVGSRGPRSLTARWNGAAFVAVPSPNVSGRAAVLEDVDGLAADDVWAVGHVDRIDTVGSRTLIIHWDGSLWTRIPAPSLGDDDAQDVLSGVVAISPDDAWAVGWHAAIDPRSTRALTLHWDGRSWTNVGNPCGRLLREVVAISSTDVWAVGGNSTCRWNGSTWTRRAAAPHPNPSVSIDLQDVTAVGPNKIWAVGLGATSCGEGVCHTGVIERWNGTSWSFTSVGEQLYGVHAIAGNDIYAVGIGRGPGVLHYNGSAWRPVPVPTPTPIGRLFAVDATPRGKLWAVGWQVDGGVTRTLAERAPSPDSGAVVGSTGVGNATVSWFGPESGSAASDQFGRYRIGGLDAGTYDFVATEPGCDPATRNVTVPAGTTIAVPLRIDC